MQCSKFNLEGSEETWKNKPKRPHLVFLLVVITNLVKIYLMSMKWLKWFHIYVCLSDVCDVPLFKNIRVEKSLFDHKIANLLENGWSKFWFGIYCSYYHGTIIRTEKKCKKISCYMRDSACKWFFVKKPKIFCSMLNIFDPRKWEKT